MMPDAKRLVGYCLRCGGDCFDGRNHRCRPKRVLVGEVVAVKQAAWNLRRRLERRPLWPPSMQPLYDELCARLSELDAALQRFGAPQ